MESGICGLAPHGAYLPSEVVSLSCYEACITPPPPPCHRAQSLYTPSFLSVSQCLPVVPTHLFPSFTGHIGSTLLRCGEIRYDGGRLRTALASLCGTDCLPDCTHIDTSRHNIFCGTCTIIIYVDSLTSSAGCALSTASTDLLAYR